MATAYQDFQCVDCRTLNFSHGYCKGCGVPPEVDGRSTRRYMGMHKQLEAATAEIAQLRTRLAEVEAELVATENYDIEEIVALRARLAAVEKSRDEYYAEIEALHAELGEPYQCGAVSQLYKRLAEVEKARDTAVEITENMHHTLANGLCRKCLRPLVADFTTANVETQNDPGFWGRAAARLSEENRQLRAARDEACDLAHEYALGNKEQLLGISKIATSDAKVADALGRVLFDTGRIAELRQAGRAK